MRLRTTRPRACSQLSMSCARRAVGGANDHVVRPIGPFAPIETRQIGKPRLSVRRFLVLRNQRSPYEASVRF